MQNAVFKKKTEWSGSMAISFDIVTPFNCWQENKTDGNNNLLVARYTVFKHSQFSHNSILYNTLCLCDEYMAKLWPYIIYTSSSISEESNIDCASKGTVR